MTKEIYLTCCECTEPAEECDFCSKDFKNGQKIMCSMESPTEDTWGHFCNQKCYESFLIQELSDATQTKVITHVEED